MSLPLVFLESFVPFDPLHSEAAIPNKNIDANRYEGNHGESHRTEGNQDDSYQKHLETDIRLNCRTNVISRTIQIKIFRVLKLPVEQFVLRSMPIQNCIRKNNKYDLLDVRYF